MAYFGDQQQLSTLVLNYGDWQTNKKSGGHIPLCQIQKSEKKGELSGKNPLAKDIPDNCRRRGRRRQCKFFWQV